MEGIKGRGLLVLYSQIRCGGGGWLPSVVECVFTMHSAFERYKSNFRRATLRVVMVRRDNTVSVLFVFGIIMSVPPFVCAQMALSRRATFYCVISSRYGRDVRVFI